MKKLFGLLSALICLILVISSALKYNIKEPSHIVKFSSWGSQSEVIVLKKLINEFEKENPDVKIKFLHIPQNYFQKIHLLVASNQEPDVVFINNQNIPMYIKVGLFEDLTSYFKDEKNKYFKEALDCFEYNNGLYAIPRDISNLVIYINKDIFKQKNIPSDIKLKNIYDLKNLAQNLTDENHFGINTEEMPLYWIYYLASEGEGIISHDLKHIGLNSEKSLDILNFYSDFVNKYHISPSKSQIGSMTTAQMFINEKLAMYISGRWMVPKFRQTINFDWDVIEFPSSDNNKLYIDSSGWALSKRSKNKPDSIKFLKFISSQTANKEFTKSGLIIPARVDVAYTNIFLDDSVKPHNNMAFLNTVKNSQPTLVVENYSSVNDILNERMLKLLNGDYNAKDIMDKKTLKKLESLL